MTSDSSVPEILRGKGLKIDPQLKLFYLKHIPVLHDVSQMAVGTDALLLGAWADLSVGSALLDIGSGCGILSIMSALRNPQLNILALEPFEPGFSLSEHNLRYLIKEWRAEVVNQTLRQFGKNTKKKFSHIISNPPFFSGGSGQSQRNHSRKASRAGETLPPSQLADHVAMLLCPEGKFHVIYAAREGEKLMQCLTANGLSLKRLARVRFHSSGDPARYLMEWSWSNGPAKFESILLYTDPEGKVRHPLLDRWTLECKKPD